MKFTTIILMCLLAASTSALVQDASEWFGRGLNAFNRGEYTESVTCYTKAIELDSSAAPAWYNRAATFIRLKKFDKAHADLDQCLKIFPGATNVKMQRAIVRSELGWYAEALEDVNAVLRGDSAFPKARLLRGRILLSALRDTTKACEDFQATLSMGDSSAMRFIEGVCR